MFTWLNEVYINIDLVTEMLVMERHHGFSLNEDWMHIPSCWWNQRVHPIYIWLSLSHLLLLGRLWRWVMHRQRLLDRFTLYCVHNTFFKSFTYKVHSCQFFTKLSQLKHFFGFPVRETTLDIRCSLMFKFSIGYMRVVLVVVFVLLGEILFLIVGKCLRPKEYSHDVSVTDPTLLIILFCQDLPLPWARNSKFVS